MKYNKNVMTCLVNVHDSFTSMICRKSIVNKVQGPFFDYEAEEMHTKYIMYMLIHKYKHYSWATFKNCILKHNVVKMSAVGSNLFSKQVCSMHDSQM